MGKVFHQDQHKRSNTEIFLDTANIEEIREAAKLGVISGVTTNPSPMMRAGRSDYIERFLGDWRKVNQK